MPFCRGCPVLWSCSVPLPVPLSFWLVLGPEQKRLLVGVAAHVRVGVGVCAAQHRTARILYGCWSKGTTAAADGFVPTVSSNPAGIRRKLGTTIRGPNLAAGTLEPGRAGEWQSGQSGCRSWAGLADRQTVKIGRMDALGWLDVCSAEF